MRENYMNGMHLLISLKRRTELFLMGSVIGILFVGFAYIFHVDEVLIKGILITDIIFIGVLLCMITLLYKKIMLVKLILDNRIVQFKQAKIITHSSNNKAMNYNKDAEMVVSCFGLLLGNKIIKYNIDGILLMSLELSEQSMNITYGNDTGNKKIRIEHEPISLHELIRISEKLRYETGIMPVLSDE